MDAEPTGAESQWLSLNGERYAQTFSTHLSLSRDVVLVFDAALLPDRSLKDRLQQRTQPRASGPFRSVAEIGDGVDMVLAAGPGSSTASVTMELLAAHGVERVVSVGTAAATSDTTADGHLCLISGAVLASANSPYPPVVGPRHGPLFDQLCAAVDVLAPALTTLWPFRVDALEVADHPGAVVEMEAATLHAVAADVGLVVECVVVISDRYRADDWQLGDAARTRSGLDRAVDVAVASLNATR